MLRACSFFSPSPVDLGRRCLGVQLNILGHDRSPFLQVLKDQKGVLALRASPHLLVAIGILICFVVVVWIPLRKIAFGIRGLWAQSDPLESRTTWRSLSTTRNVRRELYGNACWRSRLESDWRWKSRSWRKCRWWTYSLRAFCTDFFSYKFTWKAESFLVWEGHVRDAAEGYVAAAFIQKLMRS